MDTLALVGIIIGVMALIGGNFLEGGTLASLVNGPAAVIVFGGTLGAAILQTPRKALQRALTILPWIFRREGPDFRYGIDKLVRWASTARKEGLLGLEAIAETEPDRFARRGLQLLVDGNEPDIIRRAMETELTVLESRDAEGAHFYESMGGYAPTIGIIGAVMGLIHVMRNLADPSELGPGIAIAFVATIYGVGIANLFLIPIANRLKLCISEHTHYRELFVEGVIAIAEGENPRAIEMKLNGYLHQ